MEEVCMQNIFWIGNAVSQGVKTCTWWLSYVALPKVNSCDVYTILITQNIRTSSGYMAIQLAMVSSACTYIGPAQLFFL